MTAIKWNESGSRFFEAGVDRGVFYKTDGSGVPWNGLLAVNETPSGGELTPYYVDGVKYFYNQERKEFACSIEAYTYPDAFLEYDGWKDLDNGLIVDEQDRKPFGFSYRTGVGNDLDGIEHGYKIHIVYNCYATPAESEHATVSEELEPTTFSWDIATIAVEVDPSLGLMPYAHFVIDTRKSNPTQIRFVEGYLYGTEDREPQLPSLQALHLLFEDPVQTYHISYDATTGLSYLVDSNTVNGDLMGRETNGFYTLATNTRLREISPGLNVLETQ